MHLNVAAAVAVGYVDVDAAAVVVAVDVVAVGDVVAAAVGSDAAADFAGDSPHY